MWYFSYLLGELVRQCGISLIYFVIWYDNVVFLLSIVWSGTTMWYFYYLLCELVPQCGISIIYCVIWYDNVVFLLSIVWTGTTMWYFSYLLCELVRQCGISLIYCVIWYDNVVFLLSIVWSTSVRHDVAGVLGFVQCDDTKKLIISKAVIMFCRDSGSSVVSPMRSVQIRNHTV